jgi:peptidoglycan/LPS O-acetylase OafA/YrhL
LRALAVGLVVVSHTASKRLFVVLCGPLGVTIFFVLSAYLITGILLRAKGAPLGNSLRVFYARRAIRLVPAYFVCLAALYVANAPTIRTAWPWHALYLSNWYFLANSIPPASGHFWTLAIEEQFYLGWPLLVFLLPMRSIGKACGVAVLIGIASRTLFGLAAIVTEVPTPSIVDAFAIGAFLAWQRHLGLTRRWLKWAPWVGFLLLIVALYYSTPDGRSVVTAAMERFAMALMAVRFVDAAADGRLWRVFAWRPARVVGMLSYAIYLWHGPILWEIREWSASDPIARELAKGSIALFCLLTALTLPVALLSWFLVERPINAQKRRFPYPRRV